MLLSGIHNCTGIVSPHRSVCLLLDSLNPSSLINPCQSQPQPAVSANTIPPASTKPRKEPHIQVPSARRARSWWGEAKRSGIERGSGRWRAGERGFFGKGANPIMGSGAALVPLAALNSHFNGLFLNLPTPFSFYFDFFLLLLLSFFLIMADTHTQNHATVCLSVSQLREVKV